MYRKRVVLFLWGLLIMFGLSGCGKQKYELKFDGYGFESEKTKYAAGENVTVYYDMIATDTDYSFYTDSDDVELKRDYDDKHGYIFNFTMPEHDVTMKVESRNSMEYDPGVFEPDKTENVVDEINPDNMAFDYFEKTVASEKEEEHEEMVLYERDEGAGMILARYVKEEGKEETVSACLVPEDTIDDCMGIVRGYDMENWKDGQGITGKFYVIKFSHNGKDFRITSDDMPEEGRNAFSSISEILWKAWMQYSTEDQ